MCMKNSSFEEIEVLVILRHRTIAQARRREADGFSARGYGFVLMLELCEKFVLE